MVNFVYESNLNKIKYFVLGLLFSCHIVSADKFSEHSNYNDTIFSSQPVERLISTNVVDIDDNKVVEDADTIIQEDTEVDAETEEDDVILESDVKYSARDSIRFEIANQRVFLYGNADIKYEDIHLEANYIEIDFSRNEIYATGLLDNDSIMRGYPVFTEKGKSYHAKEIRYNFETERGRTVNVLTEEAEGFLHGDVVKIMDDETIHVGSGKFTTCDHPEPHFHVGFRRAKVMEKRIVTGPAFFYLMDIPMPLVIPFGFFPNTTGQASGIIIPSYGESANRGFYLKDGGFYWGINEYADLSLTGDIYSRGSWGLKSEARYNRRYRYRGNFNINYAVNVDGEEGLPDYSRRNDFRVRWNHDQDRRARPNSIFRANVNAGSSQYNRYDPSTTEDYLSNTFQSNISYSASWRDGRYNFSSNFRHSQNTITEQIDMSLPEIAFNVSRFHPFRRDQSGANTKWYEDISVSYDMNAKNEIQTTDSMFLERETWENMRNGVRHRVPISHNFNLFDHFNVNTSANYTERWYFQSIEKQWIDDPSTSTPEGTNNNGYVRTDTIPGFKAARDFTLSSGISTNIYGLHNFKRGPINAVRHVIRPSASFRYRPDFADPFWGNYKEFVHPEHEEPVKYSIFEGGIYGIPPSGESGSINFSVGNNLEIKVPSRRDENKKERKITLIDNLTISTSYDIARDSINFSDIDMRGRTRILDNFDITFRGRWTPYIVDENNNKIDKFIWEERDDFLQLVNTSWGLNFNYSLSGGEANNDNERENGSDRDVGLMDDYFLTPTGVPVRSVNFDVPWEFRLSYNFNYNSQIDQITYDADRDYTQTLSLDGNIRLTPKWRLGVSTGYDFENKDITYTSVNVFRDLHCWQMTINWIPFGFRRSYNLTIRVKASILEDLKYEQRKEFYDYRN